MNDDDGGNDGDRGEGLEKERRKYDDAFDKTYNNRMIDGRFLRTVENNLSPLRNANRITGAHLEGHSYTHTHTRTHV